MSDAPDHLPRIARALEQLLGLVPVLERVAAAVAPGPPAVVGTRYVADRLGCSAVWVAELARKQVIPPACVVPGTGRGHVWKFDRAKVDAWLAGRTGPAGP